MATWSKCLSHSYNQATAGRQLPKSHTSTLKKRLRFHQIGSPIGQPIWLKGSLSATNTHTRVRIQGDNSRRATDVFLTIRACLSERQGESLSVKINKEFWWVKKKMLKQEMAVDRHCPAQIARHRMDFVSKLIKVKGMFVKNSLVKCLVSAIDCGWMYGNYS